MTVVAARRLAMAHAGEVLVNPRTGQTMIFRKTSRDTGGALFQVETINPPHGPAEPEHIHVRQESRADVRSGTLHFKVRGQVQIVRAGEQIIIPANTPHLFWNEGDEDAHAIQEFRPALQSELFFETLFGLARDGKLTERGLPTTLQLAVMAPAFGDEIRPTRPPWFVVRMMGWLLGPIARLLGYRSSYPQYSSEAAASVTA
jgi:quercetin dioxygenase-like cupin family protein